MRVVDLTGSYIEQILRRHDLTAYRQANPGLWRHYFRYWADQRYWHESLLDPQTVRQRRTLVRSRLPYIEEKLKLVALDVAALQIILFVGQGTASGHAWRAGRTWAVWIPVEAYATPLQVEVFVTHEIIHALHYAATPAFYFNTITTKRSGARQLITEGLSTWAARSVLGVTEGEALWADYLTAAERARWLAACREREAELRGLVRRNFRSSVGAANELFLANDSRDIFKYRAGYFAGLQAVQAVAARYNFGLGELLKLPRRRFERLAQIAYLR